jgi:predicted transcriptional regulator
MARRKKTDLRTAALVLEMKETEGRSERDIAGSTGVPPSTVHRIIHGANGWGEVAEGELFKRYRQQQNKALEQAYRSLAADSMIHAAKKLPKASYAQAVLGSSILIDKARLLAGESTQNFEVHTKHEVENLENFCELLRQSLIQPEKTAIDVTPPASKQNRE